MTALTKADLRNLHRLVSAHQPLSRPVTLEEIVLAGELGNKLARLVVEMRPTLEKGALVLSWRVPREWGMTLNEYAGKPGWSKRKIRLAMDDALRAMIPTFPGADLCGAKKRRWTRITRFSQRRPDELACDAIGGKCPIDALVRCGVLANDNDTYLLREARWEKTAPGNVHVLVEVWEIAMDGTHGEEPRDAVVKQVVYTPGPMTRAIADGGDH